MKVPLFSSKGKYIPLKSLPSVSLDVDTLPPKQRQININRGSYMSAHVLLILLNELGKRDKIRGLLSIVSLFRNELNEFNKTRARMLDSIYHMTLGTLL